MDREETRLFTDKEKQGIIAGKRGSDSLFFYAYKSFIHTELCSTSHIHILYYAQKRNEKLRFWRFFIHIFYAKNHKG